LGVDVSVGRLASLVQFGALLLLLLGTASRESAQTAASPAAAPAAASTPSAGVAVSETKAPPPVIANPAQPAGSQHLIARSGPPVDEANRKALEENAGKDAASLLMRSSPTGAQIFINGAFVGRTPLLLNVAPGKYKVQMRGERDDIAERTIGLLAKDTQKITLTLGTRYPNRVSIP
jgi:hypothetical protein